MNILGFFPHAKRAGMNTEEQLEGWMRGIFRRTFVQDLSKICPRLSVVQSAFLIPVPAAFLKHISQPRKKTTG